jgi:hypothetical protein
MEALDPARIPIIQRLMLASVKHYQSVSDSKKDASFMAIFILVMGLFCGFIGIIVHVVNLDTEPSARSLAVVFLGANASFLYVYSTIGPGKWLEWGRTGLDGRRDGSSSVLTELRP